jgi:arginine exporter protein ArgO
VDAFLAGVASGYGIAIPVGVIAVLIIETGRRWGFRVAAGAGLGTALADLIYAALAVVVGLGVAHLLAAHAALVHRVSAVLLGLIAARTLLQALRAREEDTRDMRPPRQSRVVLTFLGLTLANPLTVTYFAALMAAEGVTIHGVGVALFMLGVFLASLSWQTLLATTGAVIGQQLPSGARTAIGVLSSLIIAALAVRLVLAG